MENVGKSSSAGTKVENSTNAQDSQVSQPIRQAQCYAPCFNSTYGLRNDWSYRSERFKIIPLTWKLCVSNIDALKIRIAKWKPKQDRSNQAIFYFDVQTTEEANEILKRFEKFNFKLLENRFDKWFDNDCVRIKNTRETSKWLLKVIQDLRHEFPCHGA